MPLCSMNVNTLLNNLLLRQGMRLSNRTLAYLAQGLGFDPQHHIETAPASESMMAVLCLSS